MASTPDEFGRYFGAAPATPADMGPAIGKTPPSDDFVRQSKEAAERTDRRWAGKLSPYMQIVTADPGARKNYADKAWQSFLETQEGLADQSKAINAELDRAREASERGMRQAKAERDRFRLASDARLRLAGVPDSQIKTMQAGEAARDKAFGELQAADRGVLDDYRKASDRLTKNSVAGFFQDERKRLMHMTGIDPLATWGGVSRKKQETDKTNSAIASIVSGLYADDRGGQSAADAGDFWSTSPEVTERRALAYQSPAQTFDEVDPEPGTYKGTIFELTDPREVTEYRKLKASGEYRDDQVMRLRAMRATRGDEEVRKLAWQARRGRDRALAGRLAREHGGSFSDYYVETTLEDVNRARGDYGPNATPKQAMADYYDSTLAYDRDHGSAAEKAMARRRGMYLARRWGLSFDEETAPTGRMARVPVTVSSDGWWYEPGGNARSRVAPDGSQYRQAMAGGELRTYTQTWSGLAPTRPGEALRYKGGDPITALVPERRPVGSWKLSAPRRTALRRWLDEHGEPALPFVSGPRRID